MSVVEALAREVGSVGKALHRFGAADWTAPTRCPPMDVTVLLAHMLRGATMIDQMLDGEPLDIEPERDRVTHWDYDPKAIGPGVVERATASAQEHATPSDLVAAWDHRWSRALRRAREAGNPVMRLGERVMRVEEFVATRVVEVTVHHMDVDDALGREPHPDPGALEIVGDILRARLGTDLREAGVDDVRFVLVGTGRASLDERERGMLGPLADRFPLLA